MAFRVAWDMGITDKITGRVKQAAGDLADDQAPPPGPPGGAQGSRRRTSSPRSAKVDRKAEEVANLERKTR